MKLITITAAAALTAGICLADVSVEQKTQFHLSGAVGAMVNVFSRTAREGATSTTVIKGDRKLTRTGDYGEIIDLGEEKVYMVDFGRQTYTVKTFAEMRKQWEEQQERANRSSQKSSSRSAEKNEGPEYEVDFDVKSTGQKEKINGFDTHEEIVTVTVHEKGKKIEQSGGWILTSDMWMGPKIAAMHEIYDFDRRFAQKVYGSAIGDMRSVAMAMAATPAFGKAMKVFSEKRGTFAGTPIRTNMKFDTVTGTDPSTQQKAEESKEPASPSASVMGGLLNKMKQRREQKAESGQPGRSTIFDSTSELMRASASATAAEVALPANFRQR